MPWLEESDLNWMIDPLQRNSMKEFFFPFPVEVEEGTGIVSTSVDAWGMKAEADTGVKFVSGTSFDMQIRNEKQGIQNLSRNEPLLLALGPLAEHPC